MKTSVWELMTGKKKNPTQAEEIKEASKNENDIDKDLDQSTLSFKYIQPVDEKLKLLDKFIPDQEWLKKFSMWFSYMRIYISVLSKTTEETNIDKLIQRIENGEPPQISEISGCDDICDLFAYFSKYEIDYTKNDLIWIFPASIYETRLAPDDSVKSMQIILEKIIQQVNALNSKENVLYSDLMILYCIITTFFHQH